MRFAGGLHFFPVQNSWVNDHWSFPREFPRFQALSICSACDATCLGSDQDIVRLFAFTGGSSMVDAGTEPVAVNSEVLQVVSPFRCKWCITTKMWMG